MSRHRISKNLTRIHKGRATSLMTMTKTASGTWTNTTSRTMRSNQLPNRMPLIKFRKIVTSTHHLIRMAVMVLITTRNQAGL